MRDDDIPQSVATGVADIGIVGENEYVEKNENAEIVKRLGFSKCPFVTGYSEGYRISGCAVV